VQKNAVNEPRMKPRGARKKWKNGGAVEDLPEEWASPPSTKLDIRTGSRAIGGERNKGTSNKEVGSENQDRLYLHLTLGTSKAEEGRRSC